MAKDLIINNLLCFLSSARGDYSNEALFDTIYSFYSEDEIKSAKELIADIIKQDITTRKNPERKKKELNDLLRFYTDFLSSESCRRTIFVSNSYKLMPPLGLEFIAPILVNLTEEIAKINSVLPKIVDIKSEVLNTADAVRNLKSYITNSNSSNIKSHLSIENCSTSSNYSRPQATPVSIKSKSAVNDKTPISSQSKSNKILELQQSILTASSSCRKEADSLQLRNVNDPELVNGTSSENQDNKERKTFYSRRSRRKNSSAAITGSKNTNLSFKGIERTVDVFIGRVQVSSTTEDICDYIKRNFEIDVHKVIKLDIKSENYNCFKVNINLKDREKLFSSELWPEGVVVNKFYSKKKS